VGVTWGEEKGIRRGGARRESARERKKHTPQVGISDVREHDTGVGIGAAAVGAGVVL